MIREREGYFMLDTRHTTYCFRVTETGHLEHLYYGRKITIDTDLNSETWAVNSGAASLTERHAYMPGNTNAYHQAYQNFTLEDIRLEMSSYGKGDIREPFIELVHADGGTTSDFLFEKADFLKEKPQITGMPCAYDDTEKEECLRITLRDKNYGLALELLYTVYEDCDVITRSSRLVNQSMETVQVRRLLSTQIDFDRPEFVFTTFSGTWGREMRRTDLRMRAGKHVNASYTGTSSSRANPFVMLSGYGAAEDFGDCYGFHLIYSGNHYEAVEVSAYGKTRFVSGINPQGFSWRLESGEAFEAPEAAMAFSAEGFNGMSQCMHRFIRRHIVRGEWRDKLRPVILNSWEAAYFDIDEEKLLRLAKAGKEIGIELFVMDDGWFGNRNDDTSSLGDWEVNTKKLPHGLSGLCEKINGLGLDFGIWVEPEMVNVNSRLYEKHPEWVMDIPGKPHSEGRNQRILDLTKREVQDFIIEKMTKVFSTANIAYVKWDMNRTFADYYSKDLPAERQGETAHRYILGLYRCMKKLTERFPQILFEGCSAGGNRFDPGILSYFPQIWASDNTDALCRAEIQNGYSYGYPMSAVSAHVSVCPNHQTSRITPLETRFHVAAFGVCGYEYNFCDMGQEELEAVRQQIALYKKWREILQKGSFYRGRNFYDEGRDGESVLAQMPANQMEWTCVSPDREKAVGFLMKKYAIPNMQYEYYRAKGLDETMRYRFYGRWEDRTEERCLYGDMLMCGGVRLKPAFGGNDNMDASLYRDFGSCMYFMEKI